MAESGRPDRSRSSCALRGQGGRLPTITRPPIRLRRRTERGVSFHAGGPTENRRERPCPKRSTRWGAGWRIFFPVFTVVSVFQSAPHTRFWLGETTRHGVGSTSCGPLPRDESGPRTRLLDHVNRCLGCRACETACPAGVRYGSLLEKARQGATEERGGGRLLDLTLESLTGRSTSRLVYALARLARGSRIARLGARLLPGRAGLAFGMLAATRRSTEQTVNAGSGSPANTKSRRSPQDIRSARRVRDVGPVRSRSPGDSPHPPRRGHAELSAAGQGVLRSSARTRRKTGCRPCAGPQEH